MNKTPKDKTLLTESFKTIIHGVDGSKYWVPVDFARGIESRWRKARKAEMEATAKMCQAVGQLSTIAEDCEAWLQSEIQEPSVEFIKAVRDYAKNAVAP
jgi:hypothetical protein